MDPSPSILALYIGKELGFFGFAIDKVLEVSCASLKSSNLSLLKILSKNTDLKCSEGSIYLIENLLQIDKLLFFYNPSYGSISHVYSIMKDQESRYPSILLPKKLHSLLDSLILESLKKPWFQFIKLYGADHLEHGRKRNEIPFLQNGLKTTFHPVSPCTFIEKEKMCIGSITFNNKVVLNSTNLMITKQDLITSFGFQFQFQTAILHLEVIDHKYSLSQFPVLEGNPHQLEIDAFSSNSNSLEPYPFLQPHPSNVVKAIASFWFSQFLILADLNHQASMMTDLAMGLLEEAHHFHLEKQCNCPGNGPNCDSKNEWHIYGIDIVADS